MEIEIEIWKYVPNYEDYQVSNLGNVKSFKLGKEIVLKQYKDRGGYLSVYIRKNGIRKFFSAHVLVAIVFLGHIPDGTQNIVVDHKDNNKLNNRLDNLRLTSQRENSSKDRKGGTSKYIGVYLDKKTKKWRVEITFNGRSIHLGYFELEIDAANAYQNALKLINEGVDLNILYPKRVKSSQYEGVYWSKSAQKWEANYKGKYLGVFIEELEAYEVRQKYKLQLLNNNI